jgi:hypothetical protein
MLVSVCLLAMLSMQRQKKSDHQDNQLALTSHSLTLKAVLVLLQEPTAN